MELIGVSSKKSLNVEVSVIGNIEKSLRQLKKKIEREGVVRDMKRIVYFEPPTQRRRKRLMRAIKNNLMKNAENLLHN
jgi:small subunit ribosomal protein S21